MTLKEIASVSGKPGLYKVVQPTRTGIILETIDDQKKKIIANANSRVSLLKEISVYTTTEEGSVLLEDVFKAIKNVKGNSVAVGNSDAELFTFLGEVIPDFDRSRVYSSDIKKMVLWFNTVNKYYPELISDAETKEEVNAKELKKDNAETKVEEKPKKEVKAKKEPAAKDNEAAPVKKKSTKKEA